MPRKSDQFSVIGKRQPRLDGVSKATGRSEFTDDVNLPGMLHAKIVRSPIPSGKILNIDTSKAEKLPGVKAVITYNDTNGLMAGPDEFVFCENEVKFFGDEVAAVAAVDEDTADEAARLIKVDYEPTKALFSMEEALAKGSPAVHEHCEDNIADDRIMKFGDSDKALAEADYIREDEYKINPNHQSYAEHHVVVADYSLPDRLTIWTPMQVASIPQSNLAFKLGLSESKVRIMNLNSGGCFCGRGSEKTHHYAALLLSRKTGRPVKQHCTADEEFLVSRGGGTYNFKFKTGVMKDGTLKAFDVDLLLDSGAYMDVQFINLMFIGQSIQMLYKVDASKFSGRLVYTNNHPYFFHHGTGMVSMRFAMGAHLDLIARDLGIDPVEFRLKNAVDKKFVTPSKIEYGSCGLKDCIKVVSKKSGWKKKYGKLKPYHGIGIGCGVINSGGKGMFMHDTSAVVINVEEDGTVTLFTGLPDMGQGSHTAMAMIAAETLGVGADDVRVISGDTDIAPFDVGAIGQRGTFTTGHAAKRAAIDVKQQIAKTAAQRFNVKASALVFKDGKVYPKDAPDQAVSFEDMVYDTLNSKEGRYVMGNGFYNPPTEGSNPTTGEGNWSMAYSFGAQVAEVEVDPDTGQVKLLNMTVAHDVGRAINPLAVEGQIDGQVFSGMGQTMFEECLMDNGQVLNPSYLDYRLPRAYEIPELGHTIVESIDPYGPFGAKEVGQGPIQCTTQAIANAVSNAIGYPVNELPITPERVLKLIKQKEKEPA